MRTAIEEHMYICCCRRRIDALEKSGDRERTGRRCGPPDDTILSRRARVHVQESGGDLPGPAGLSAAGGIAKDPRFMTTELPTDQAAAATGSQRRERTSECRSKSVSPVPVWIESTGKLSHGRICIHVGCEGKNESKDHGGQKFLYSST